MTSKFSVIGAGTMGHGIAEVIAMAGHEVWLNDVTEEILRNALKKVEWSLRQFEKRGKLKESVEDILKRIHTTTNQDEALKDAEFMVEAVIEDLELKRKIFQKADKLASPEAILATNTSSIPISEIAEATSKPERVIGMHFFNPPPLMQLIEVIRGNKTSNRTVEVTIDVGKKLGKVPVLVKKDVPGFISNRMLFRITEGACYLVQSGKATIQDVDYTTKKVLGFPMGVFFLHDYIGIDVSYYIVKAMTKRGFEMYECRLLEEKFSKKEFGVKTEKGFYTHPSQIQEGRLIDPTPIIAPAINEAHYLIREDIASKEDIDTTMKLGFGWPKGIFDYVKEIGEKKVKDTLEELRRQTGLSHFAPVF